MGKIDGNLNLGNRERMIRTCLNMDIDRLPFWHWFGPWGETIERWRHEGLGEKNWDHGFGFDAGFGALPVDLGLLPKYEWKVLSDDGDKRTIRDERGISFIEIKNHSTIPYYIDYPVKNRADWKALKEERFNPDTPGRFPPNWLDTIKLLKEKDAAIQIGGYPHGLFGTLRDLIGVEDLLVMFYDDPELIRDMTDYLTGFWISLYEKALHSVQIDHIHIWEDMSGKQGPLISPSMYREYITPNYKRIAAFAKKNGIPLVSVDTDGNMDVLMPLLKEAGVNLALPFEVQAGCDVNVYKTRYPDIGIIGGIDKRKIALGREETDRELARLAPMFEASGYIPMLDHLPHPEISYGDFCYFIESLRKRIFR